MNACRICQERGSQYGEIEDILKDLLDALLISLDMTASQESIICKDCTTHIYELFDFKTMCLYTEDALLPFVEENASKLAQLDLRSMYSESKLCQFSESKERVEICRLCLEITTQWVPLEMATSQTSVRDVFNNNLPEIMGWACGKLLLRYRIQAELTVAFPRIESRGIFMQQAEKQAICATVHAFFHRHDIPTLNKVHQSLISIKHPCICEHCLKMLNNLHSFAFQCKSSANDMVNGWSSENLSIKIKVEIQLGNQVENQVRKLTTHNVKNQSENHFDNECKIETSEISIDCVKNDVERFVLSGPNLERHTKEEESDLRSTAFQDFPLGHSKGPISRDYIGKKSHICLHCRKNFSRKSNLDTHLLTHTGEKPHICSHCGKGFSHRTSFKYHLILHTGEKPYVCGQCGMKFSGKINLNYHLLTHTGKKPQICSYCGKGFSIKWRLNRHLRIHTGEKPHVCGQCGKAFSQKGDLNIHSLTHTGEKPFTCLHCENVFSRKSYLRVHLFAHRRGKEFPRRRKHLTGEESRNICSYCGKEFSKKSQLNYHLLTHTGEKPHNCLHCGKGFTLKSHLKVHMFTHTGEKPHICSYCGKGFSVKTHLNAHLLTHTGEKPHICSNCGKRFTQKCHLKRHYLIHAKQ